MVSAAYQVRELVAAYLRNEINLEAFANRFAVLFDDIEDCNDAEAIRLSYQIESCLADASAGLSSENQLRETVNMALLSVPVEAEPDFRVNEEFFVKKETTSMENHAEVVLT